MGYHVTGVDLVAHDGVKEQLDRFVAADLEQTWRAGRHLRCGARGRRAGAHPEHVLEQLHELLAPSARVIAASRTLATGTRGCESLPAASTTTGAASSTVTTCALPSEPGAPADRQRLPHHPRAPPASPSRSSTAAVTAVPAAAARRRRRRLRPGNRRPPPLFAYQFLYELTLAVAGAHLEHHVVRGPKAGAPPDPGLMAKDDRPAECPWRCLGATRRAMSPTAVNLGTRPWALRARSAGWRRRIAFNRRYTRSIGAASTLERTAPWCRGARHPPYHRDTPPRFIAEPRPARAGNGGHTLVCDVRCRWAQRTSPRDEVDRLLAGRWQGPKAPLTCAVLHSLTRARWHCSTIPNHPVGASTDRTLQSRSWSDRAQRTR